MKKSAQPLSSDYHRCSAMTHARDGVRIAFQCTRPGVLRVNERWYCTQHKPIMQSTATQRADGGHGHVTSRSDGKKAKCGGPGICHECSVEVTHELRRLRGALELARIRCEEAIAIADTLLRCTPDAVRSIAEQSSIQDQSR